MSSAAAEELVGEVGRLVFASEATGFGVVELLLGDGDEVRAAGPLAGVVAGQPIRLVGRWNDHPKYGPTFDAVLYEHAPPRSPQALEAFLASDRFPGIGQATARKLVEAFGTEVGEVALHDPQRLARVRGVSTRQAQVVADVWRRSGALAELVQLLGDVGLGPAVARAAHRRFGDDAVAVLDADPYALLSVRGAGWAPVERLARGRGVGVTDERRLRAGARHAVSAALERGGHTYLLATQAVAATRQLLGCDALDAGRALEAAAAARALVREADAAGGDDRVLRPAERSAERRLARDLARLLGGGSRIASAVGTPTLDPALTALQADAVRTALRAPVSVLSGGPGTGKTRTVVEVVRACLAAQLNVALAAPTGRAAKRLEEVVGVAAGTVHRLLEARPEPGGGFVFGRDADRRLPHDLVVADEWSMADVHLAAALVEAVDDGAHLLLVGDAHQLPSVGPGAVLRDLLAQPHIPATVLDVVHRQAQRSRITTLAHEIDAGDVHVPRGRDGDVFAVPERTGGIAARVAEIVAVRAPAYFDCTPADVQVLAPMYRGDAGVDALNAAIGERVNPAAGRRAVGGFREGDRVVQTRNDAELDVANGDIGEVIVVDGRERTLDVAFPQGTVHYGPEAVADLRPAWCLTVHKAQGAEWPVVVVVLDPSHRAMLWRELVYTAVSRAQRGLLLVGRPALLSDAARRTGSGLARRQTLLQERLAAAIAKVAVADADRSEEEVLP